MVATDAVQQGVRSLFVDDTFQILSEVEYRGKAKLKTKDSGNSDQVFTRKGAEVELAQGALIGMLDHYRRNQLDVAMEGLHVTPEWVKSIYLEGYEIRAAFVGFNSSDHVENILAYAEEIENDWINEWLQLHDNDIDLLRERIGKKVQSNKDLEERAKKLGFAYFDITSMTFEDYVDLVRDHLLSE